MSQEERRAATAEIRRLISQLAGNTIFGVTFRRRSDGELRNMVCRLSAPSYVKGEHGLGRAYDPIEYGLLTVFDMQRHGWRSVPVENVIRLQVRGEVVYNRKEESCDT